MKIRLEILMPILLMLLITPLTPLLDLAITRRVYVETLFQGNSFFDALYNYGCWPAYILCGLALIVFVASYFYNECKRWRSAALALVIVMAIGPGLIVNAVLKDHWGRPRPRQTMQFGGTEPFSPYYIPHFSAHSVFKSFPCGHCSMGFYFFSLALIGRRYGHRGLFYAGLILAIGLGTVLGVARIVQGGHYLSDVLMSALILWLVSIVTVDFFCKPEETATP